MRNYTTCTAEHAQKKKQLHVVCKSDVRDDKKRKMHVKVTQNS